MPSRLIPLVLILIGLYGCASIPATINLQSLTESLPSSLSEKIPTRFRAEEALPSAVVNNSTPSNTSPTLIDWLKQLQSTRLQELAQKALAHNATINLAESNIRKARAAARSSAQTLAPSAQISLGRNDTINGGHTTNRQFTAQVGLDWEWDIFGRRWESYVGKDLTLLSSEAQSRLQQQAVLTELIRQWLSVQSLAERLHLATAGLQVLTKRQQLVHLRYHQGEGNADEVALIDLEVINNETVLRAIRAQQAAVVRSVQILVGEYPDGRLDYLDRIDELPTPPSLNLRAPIETLHYRPDIASAFWQVHATSAELSSALKSQWLPRLTLGLDGTTSAKNFGDVLVAPNVWTLGINLIKNLFSPSESLERALAQENATQSLIQYVDTTLKAMANVENQLDILRKSHADFESAKRAERLNRVLMLIADQRYNDGLIDAEDWIERLRAWLNAEQNLVSAHEAWINAQLLAQVAMGMEKF